MKLENIDEVARLRNERQNALALIAAAHNGTFNEIGMWHEGKCLNALSVISDEPLRSAIIVAAEQLIKSIDIKLNGLGVNVGRIDQTPETIDDWKRTAEMYARAWLRELGGKLVPKAHFIDALVLTTRQMRERAERAPAEPPKER
jgi:hypothetical protein